MKPRHPSDSLFNKATLLAALFLCLCATTLRAATTNAPSISGLIQPGTISDEQTNALFTLLAVDDGDNNGLGMSITISPSSLGSFRNLGAGVTSQGGGLYTIAFASQTTVGNEFHTLQFAPVPFSIPVPNSSNVTFSITATNSSGLSSNFTFTVRVNSTNHPPVINPGSPTRFNINDEQTTQPFVNVNISDPDNGGQQSETVTVSLDDTNKGALLVGGSGFTANADGTYSLSDIAGNVTTAIHALTFVPTPNRLPVGQKETNTFTILVDDGYNPRSDSSVNVVVTSINDPPVITGVSSTPQPAQTGRTILPFQNPNVADVDRGTGTNGYLGQLLTLTVGLSGAGPLGQLEAGGGVTGTNYVLSGATAGDVVSALKTLVYRPSVFPQAFTNTVILTVSVNDGFATTTTNAAVYVYTPVTPPGLSGTASGQHVNDNSTIALFSGVTMQSFNAGSFIVVIQLDSDVKGQLVNLGGFVKANTLPSASYSFTGTAQAATAAIRQLLFQPTPNRINGSTNETTFFTLTMIDGGVTNVPDTSTTVIVTPVNDAPTIQGISPLVTIPDSGTQAPFPTVLITDVDELGQQQVTVTVSLDDNAKGSFSPTNLIASGFVSSNGNYQVTGTPGGVTFAIRQLVFVPTPHRIPVGLTENTTFNIAVDDHQGGLVSNNGSVIRVAALSGGPVINVPPTQPVSLPFTPPIQPLSLVSISDQQNVTVTVLLTNTAWGSFTSNSLAANGFTNNAPGSYVFSGSASNATTSLGALQFIPNTNLVVGTAITFSITARDQTGNSTTASLAVVFRQNQRTLIVTRTDDYDPAQPSLPDSVTGGTLRRALADAGSNDHITFDIRSTVSGVPDYPATIRLKSTLVLNKNVTIDGPGANQLFISGDTNSDGVADVELFVVNALVTVNRLTLTKGHHSFAGGVAEVNEGGTLNLSYCAVTDSRAEVWGGGIDVNGGGLNLDHCLIRGNSTGAATGQGGGGISIYTVQPCVMLDTTFSANQQLSPGGLGGGALYVEDLDPGTELDVFILSCTFHENVDASSQGSSIRPNVFNTTVQLQNTIVADGSGKNLEMDESGAIISLGGNISDDGTATIYSAGGAPVDTVILDQPTDRTNLSPVLLSLANNGGPTLTYALATNSPAVGNAASNTPAATFYTTLGTDQRGFFRDTAPDNGAFELNAGQRVIIEEMLVAPAAPNTNNQFIEFYVPHDSTNLDLGGYQVLVGGNLRHTFTSQPLNPGEALVLFSQHAVGPSVPTGVHMQIAAGDLSMDPSAGTVTLLNPSNQVVFSASYVGAFSSSDPNDPGFLTASNQSLVLSPQFQGVFLPYQRVVAKEGGRIPATNELSNPGYDASGNALAIGNAPPRAYNDVAATDAATPLPAVLVLANDIDPDVTDTIRVVGVGVTNGIAPGVTNSTGASAFGALLSINNSPQTGASITYDPSASVLLRALPPGSNVVDTFQYTILDSSNGIDHARGSTPAEISNNIVKATATVSVTVTGVNFPPTPQDDSVSTDPRLITSEDALLDFTTADTLLANDTDPNSDDNGSTLTIVSVESTNGYVNSFQAISALGAAVTLYIRFDRNQTHITYDPRNSAILEALGQGQSAVDTFYYSVMDRHGAFGTAAVHVTVTGINDAPVANPNSFATDEDTPLTIPIATVLANDFDVDTGITNPVPPHLTLSLPSALSAQGAGVQVVGTNVIYNPTVSSNLNALARKESTVDTFTYTITDDFGASSNSMVSVTVLGRNDPPIGVNDAYVTGEKIPVPMAAPGVLANDHDPDVNGHAPDDTIRAIPFANFVTAGGATVNLNADGSFLYDPHNSFAWLKQGQLTTDTFTYSVMDHSLSIANDDLFTVQAGSSSNNLAVLANDVILSQAGGSISIVGVTAPSAGGAVAINAQANGLIYTPAISSGTETFTYTISDGIGGTDTANVTVTMTGSRPQANPDWFTVAKGTTANLDVLANDTILPASATPLTVAALGVPDHGGAVSLNGIGPNNLITYTPNSTNTTPFTETFTYVLSAGSLPTATGMVAVTVIDRGNTLSANDDSFTVIAGGGSTSLDVLANDQILPAINTNLTIIAVTNNGNALSGTISINAARNRLVYQPGVNVTSHIEPLITYTISDGAGGTASANVSIQVQPSGFFANGDVFSVIKNSQNNGLTVLANDAILPNQGQPIFITAIGISNNAPNQGGTVTINQAGNGLVYTPAANFSGQETFTYEISYGTAARASGSVLVKVIDFATLKSSPDAYSVARDSTGNVLTVLKNDYVMPRTPGTLTITGLQTNGTQGAVSINGMGPDNTLVYTPKAGFIGTEIIGYTISDGRGNAATNQANVIVGGLITRDDNFAALSGSASNSLDVLANDLLLPDTLGVRPISTLGIPDQGGTVTTNPAATKVLYTPAPGFAGTEHFTYQMKDDTGGVVSGNATVSVARAGSDRDTRTVTITLVGTNDPPVVTGIQTGFAITDKQTVQPFTNVTISDVDEHGTQRVEVTITLDNAAKGVLQNLGGFINTAAGTYKMLDNGSNLTASIRGLTFVPTPNRIPVPTSELTILTMSTTDFYVSSPLVTNSTINVTSVNDPPTIAGTGALRVYDRLSLRPFAGVTVADVDNLGLQPLAATVSLDLTNHGFLTALGGFAGSNGVYSISNITPAQLTAMLRAIVFVPTTTNRLAPGGSETSRLTLAVNDGFAAPVVDNNTTITAIDGFSKRMTNSDGTTSDPFNSSVAAGLNITVVGAPYDNGAVGHSGSAYVYYRNQGGADAWGQFTKLTGTSNATSGDLFGFSAGLSGTTAIIGAPGAVSNGVATGVAYIFDRDFGGSNAWGLVKRLLPPDGVSGDQFGNSVAINGDTAVVGAIQNHGTGSAYVFSRNQNGTNQWGFVRKLSPSDGASGDQFGASVAINVDTAAVGAPRNSGAAAAAGAVYVFGRNQSGPNLWGQVKKSVALDPYANALLGSAVGISGDLVVAGAPFDTGNGTLSGSAYVFSRNQSGSNQWGQADKLVPGADVGGNATFGAAVSVDGEIIVIGVPTVFESVGIGVSFVYVRNYPGLPQWSLVRKLVVPTAEPYIRFGSAVSLNLGTLAIAAHMNDASNNRLVLTYIFRVKFDNSPILIQPLANQAATTGVPFGFAPPTNTWADTDIGDSFTYSLSSVPAPPAWLTIDPVTGVLGGIPNAPGTFNVGIIATDLDGLSSTDQIVLTVTGPAAPNVFGFVTMSAQSGVAGPTTTFSLTGLPGYTYRLQRSPVIGSGAVWTDVQTVTTDTNGTATFFDPSPTSPAFYRASWP